VACFARRFCHLANKALRIAAVSNAAGPDVEIIMAPGHSRTCCPVLQRSDGALMDENTGLFGGSAVAAM
jgi:hypothetical protein